MSQDKKLANSSKTLCKHLRKNFFQKWGLVDVIQKHGVFRSCQNTLFQILNKFQDMAILKYNFIDLNWDISNQNVCEF